LQARRRALFGCPLDRRRHGLELSGQRYAAILEHVGARRNGRELGPTAEAKDAWLPGAEQGLPQRRLDQSEAVDLLGDRPDLGGDGVPSILRDLPARAFDRQLLRSREPVVELLEDPVGLAVSDAPRSMLRFQTSPSDWARRIVAIRAEAVGSSEGLWIRRLVEIATWDCSIALASRDCLAISRVIRFPVALIIRDLRARSGWIERFRGRPG
jgi:hypothetical protein